MIPPNVLFPGPEADLPEGLQITRDGVMVGGASIGTPEYMDATTKPVFAAMHLRLRAPELLKEHGEDQMAWYLLNACTSTATTHLLRTIPVHITTPHATIFELPIDRVRETILGDVDDMCDPEQVQRAHALVGLPVKEGGLGHMRTALIAPLAFLAGVVAESNLPQFTKKREKLTRDIVWTHERATVLLGGRAVVAERRIESPDFA